MNPAPFRNMNDTPCLEHVSPPMSTPPDPQHDGNSAVYRRGMEEIRRQLGPMADASIASLEAISPEFARVTSPSRSRNSPRGAFST